MPHPRILKSTHGTACLWHPPWQADGKSQPAITDAGTHIPGIRLPLRRIVRKWTKRTQHTPLEEVWSEGVLEWIHSRELCQVITFNYVLFFRVHIFWEKHSSHTSLTWLCNFFNKDNTPPKNTSNLCNRMVGGRDAKEFRQGNAVWKSSPVKICMCAESIIFKINRNCKLLHIGCDQMGLLSCPGAAGGSLLSVCPNSTHPGRLQTTHQMPALTASGLGPHQLVESPPQKGTCLLGHFPVGKHLNLNGGWSTHPHASGHPSCGCQGLLVAHCGGGMCRCLGAAHLEWSPFFPSAIW